MKRLQIVNSVQISFVVFVIKILKTTTTKTITRINSSLLYLRAQEERIEILFQKKEREAKPYNKTVSISNYFEFNSLSNHINVAPSLL